MSHIWILRRQLGKMLNDLCVALDVGKGGGCGCWWGGVVVRGWAEWHSCAWHDSFVYVTSRIYMCRMTHSEEWSGVVGKKLGLWSGFCAYGVATYECVMPHIWMSQITHEWGMSHTWISPGLKESIDRIHEISWSTWIFKSQNFKMAPTMTFLTIDKPWNKILISRNSSNSRH